MKRWTLVVLIAACLSGRGNAADAGKTQDATAEFRPRVEKVLAAWATLDPSKAAAYYAKDPDLVFFDIAPLKYTGWKDYEAGFRQTVADWKSLKLTLGPDFKAYSSGNVAWATYTVSFEIEPRSGDTMRGEARGTGIFEKRGDGWLIIHEHVSAPMQ